MANEGRTVFVWYTTGSQNILSMHDTYKFFTIKKDWLLWIQIFLHISASPWLPAIDDWTLVSVGIIISKHWWWCWVNQPLGGKWQSLPMIAMNSRCPVNIHECNQSLHQDLEASVNIWTAHLHSIAELVHTEMWTEKKTFTEILYVLLFVLLLHFTLTSMQI